jgi:hypothetical protein
MNSRAWLLILLAASYCCSLDLFASGWEYYLEYQLRVPLVRDAGVSAFFKEETRYRDNDLYYRKTFFGVSKKINQSLDLSFLFAFREFKSRQWRNLYLFWPEANYTLKIKDFRLVSNTKLERHTSQRFWKLRENMRLLYPLNSRFTVWTGYEFRHFFFKGYPLDHEFLAGVNSKVFDHFAANIYYDFNNTRELGRRKRTNCLRTVFDIKF